jgi:hypothetical protein
VARIVGIDFDNTIVCCDEVFFNLAVEMGMIPNSVDKAKNAVRDYIRAHFSNQHWTLLQAEVYGLRLIEAKPYPGVRDFLVACRENGVVVQIISHKTRYPAAEKKYDLHRSALSWLSANGFFDADNIGLSPELVIFAPTRQKKIDQIRARACSVFVDDLPEVFAEANFPDGVKKILFDPKDFYSTWNGGVRVLCWDEIRHSFFHGASCRS